MQSMHTAVLVLVFEFEITLVGFTHERFRWRGNPAHDPIKLEQGLHRLMPPPPKSALGDEQRHSAADNQTVQRVGT